MNLPPQEPLPEKIPEEIKAPPVPQCESSQEPPKVPQVRLFKQLFQAPSLKFSIWVQMSPWFRTQSGSLRLLVPCQLLHNRNFPHRP